MNSAEFPYARHQEHAGTNEIPACIGTPMTRRSFLSTAVPGAGAAVALPGRSDLPAENIVDHDGAYTLAPGPKVEGVVF
jgi:hypothetical protein